MLQYKLKLVEFMPDCVLNFNVLSGVEEELRQPEMPGELSAELVLKINSSLSFKLDFLEKRNAKNLKWELVCVRFG